MKVCVWGGTIEGGGLAGEQEMRAPPAAKAASPAPSSVRSVRGPSARLGVFGGHEFAFPDARLRPRLGLSVTSVGRPTWGSIPWAPGAPCRGQDQTCPPADGLLTRPALPLARALQGRAVS